MTTHVAGTGAQTEIRDACFRVASIDLGTVSSRLLCAEVRGGAVETLSKRTVITDLGEGVDATGSFTPGAVERVLGACATFAREIASLGIAHTATTLTSAARDASNAGVLLDGLRALGLDPQVIPGQVEARLTFCGVASDFPGERLAVVDSGGGSTEVALGSCIPTRSMDLESGVSLDIGCRRVTERFFGALPPSADEVARAVAWMRPQFDAHWGVLPTRPDRLVAVGGTVTTLVAMLDRLEVYDSSRVHLRELTYGDVARAADALCGLDATQIAALPGVQAKRAPVLAAGALIIRELMAAGAYPALTVSENSLLAGMATTMWEALDAGSTAIGWMPRISRLGA